MSLNNLSNLDGEKCSLWTVLNVSIYRSTTNFVQRVFPDFISDLSVHFFIPV